MTIENPAPFDRYMAAKSIDTAHFESFDINHVRDKFPHAPGYLSTRLGKAISARRQFLKYSEAHRQRLKAGLLENTGVDHQSTVASALPPSTLGPYLAIKSSDIDDLETVTSFATSLAAAGTLTVPPFPSTARYEEEFECPLCFCIVFIADFSSWKYVISSQSTPTERKILETC
jgi:hypothetical protein